MGIGGVWKRFFQKGAPLQSTGLQLSVSLRNAELLDFACHFTPRQTLQDQRKRPIAKALAPSGMETGAAPRQKLGGRKRGPVSDQDKNLRKGGAGKAKASLIKWGQLHNNRRGRGTV